MNFRPVTAHLTLKRRKGWEKAPVVALAGNPNTGKSTLFNAITGLKQHTGNWPGKTVALKWGAYRHRGRSLLLVDLPGTYSLVAGSPEEQVARDFLLLHRPEVTVVVADATCLERNLHLVLQVLEITPRTVLAVNLMDEARRRHLEIDTSTLARELGIPVVGTAATVGLGIKELLDRVDDILTGKILPQPQPLDYGEEIEAAIARLLPLVEANLQDQISPRWLALRLLEGNHQNLPLKSPLPLAREELWCGTGENTDAEAGR